ncbi:MAG TPA: LLM class flavin-dependent oxidoreductase [Myxococcota bacterium]|nr:LLM class flavin-dependent oxidoreductase [Myxococcota bacterium]
MKLGLILVAPSIADQVAAARHAEARGFDSAWTIEFFNMNGFVRLAAVATATSRIKLGTGIAYAFMRTPLLASSAAMDIDELSGGRMILGLGSGTRSMNERWYSVRFDDPPAPRMREAVQLVRAAVGAQKGGGLRFDGKYYKIDIPQYSRPGAPRAEIPIYVAAVNRGMIRAAAAVADGLVGHPIYTRKYIREHVLPELAGTRCALAPYVMCSVSDDVDQARREVRAQIAFYYSTKLYHSVLDAHGLRGVGEEIASAFKRGDFAAMTKAVPDALVDEIAIAGRPDEARDRLRQWQGLTEQPLLYAATVGAAPGRVRENLAAIADTFGTR